MLIHLLNLLSQDGKEEQIQTELEMNTVQMQDQSYKILQKEPVEIHLCHKGEKKVELEGHMNLVIEIPCGRCLDPVKVPFTSDFQRELDLNQTEEERLADLDEVSYLDGLDLDVEQLVRNEILMQWPIRVLCKEDCQGICSHCGVNLNRESCDCDTHELDPRMAAISDIFSKFKEV